MDDELDTPQRIARLTPLADVLARIKSLVARMKAHDVGVSHARGLVLAADIVAARGIPATALALRDGFAAPSEAIIDAGGYAPAVLAAPPVRIDVGDPLPPGTDAVLPLDAVNARDGRHEVLATAVPGDGVLAAHGDIAPGAILRRAGHRLRPLDIAVLAAAGIDQVSVRAPRISLARTWARGDAVLDAARALIAGMLAAEGATLIDGDTLDLAAALGDTRADAIVAIGGTGSGRHDRSIETLARVGRVEAHGIAISPGETAAFGMAGPRPVLLLPGRIDAALAAWLLLGRPMLAQLSGRVEAPAAVPAKLTRKVTSALGLTEIVPVRLRDGAAEPIASGYVPHAALAQSDGWILIAAESEGYPPGAEVMIQAWP